jgi:hypothetical protein
MRTKVGLRTLLEPRTADVVFFASTEVERRRVTRVAIVKRACIRFFCLVLVTDGV